MAELWYYTTEGKQMDPVAIGELQRLVGAGTLKPTDMVWKDGMPRWIRASTLKELFGGPVPEARFSPSSAPEMTSVAPASSGAPVAVDEDDPRGSRRRRPQDEADSSRGAQRLPGGKKASNTPIILSVIVGALLLVGSLGVGVFILIAANKESKVNNDNLVKGEAKYNLTLGPDARESRSFSFRKGVDYQITVTTLPALDGLDVDMHIFDSRGRQVAGDDGPHRDCNFRWIPDADGEYRVEVHNLNQFGRAVQVTCAVSIKEFKDVPPIVEKELPKDVPLPADVMEGRGFKDDFKFSPTKKEDMQKFRVKAKHKATFTFVPSNPKSDYNLVVVKDSDANKVIEQDVGPEARASVSFTLDATEIVQVRIVNLSGKAAGAKAFQGTLSYDVSP